MKQMRPDEKEQLIGRAVNAAKWNYLGNTARMVVQFGAGVLLARMLGPDAFGVVAIAWVVIGAGKLVSDLGFSAALVQRQDIEEKDIGFIFFAQVLLGALMSIGGYLSAGLIAAFFNKPEARPIIEVMASLFFITALGQSGVAVLTRRLELGFVQGTSIATYLIGYILVGLPAAYKGYGAWSLVAAQLTQAALYSLVICIKSGVSMRPSLRPATSGIFRFGSKVMAANIANWVIINIDGALIGRYLGVTELGIYNRTMTLVSTPTMALVGGLQSVLFSTASRMQGDKPKVTMLLIACMQVMAAVCFPVFLVIALAPGPVIEGVYGEAWLGAIPVLAPLALAMPVTALLSVIGPVLTALNRAELEVQAQVMTVAVLAGVVLVAAKFSVVAVAWAVLLAYVFRLLMLLTSISRVLEIGFLQIARAVFPHAVFGGAVAVTTIGLLSLLDIRSAVLSLMALMLIALVVTLGYLRLFGPCLVTGAVEELLRSGRMLPPWVGRWMRIRQRDDGILRKGC